jgi:hypothetical protein
MKAKPQLTQSVQEDQIRTVLNGHWHASAVGVVEVMGSADRLTPR